MKKTLGLLMAMFLLAGTALFSSGQQEESGENEKVVLKYATTAKAATGEEFLALVDLAAEKGFTIEPVILPDSTDATADKLLISLMAGEEFDIVYGAYPNMKRYYNAGLITPIDEIAEELNYDMEGIFGKYLPKFEGKTYGLSAFVDIWITLFNKSIFDNAGVPYPSAEGWTWEKYIETARKLTDAEKGIYGSYMLDYNCYNYMLAAQKQVPYYKADGTSNLDDPAFAEAMEFYYGLGNVEKIQPDFLTFRTKSLRWDAFTSGNYGMFVCGGWTTYLMSARENYPRDWKFGILPMPYPEGEEKTTLTVTGNYWIPSTSKHKKEAFQAIAAIAEEQYKLGFGRVPARVDLPEEEIARYINEELAAPFADDDVTVADFSAAWFDPSQLIVPEKVIGPGDVMTNQAFVEEGELYGIGQQTLEEAMSAVYKTANEAIKADLEQ